MNYWQRHRALLGAAMALTLSLAMGGCGDDDDDGRATQTPTAKSTPPATMNPNQPPVLAPIGDRTVVFGSDLLIQVAASDPEGAPVTLSAAGLPDNSYFLSDSGVFCILANLEEQIGNPFEVTFTASDGSATSSETVTIEVVRPDAGGLADLGTLKDLRLEPIGDQSAQVGETLTLQLSASGASPIVYRMYPDAAITRVVTLDAATGIFRFSPTADEANGTFQITFQACVPGGADCRAQLHETVNLTVTLPGGAPCPDYLPARCTVLTSASQLPGDVRGCYVIKTGGAEPWVFTDVNILDKGALYFVEDPDNVIDVRFHSVLVEMGGVLQAGSDKCPFGQQASMLKKKGGKLTIGLYGDDPSDQYRVPSPTPGIQCLTGCKPADPKSCSTTRCFPRSRDFAPNKYYCTNSNSDDPCFETKAPKAPCAGFPATATQTFCDANFLQEDYHNLNFDPTPWGYKVLGVSYGGALRLFGYKGAKPLQDMKWRGDYDSNDHCVAPKADQSTLDKAEMQAWADLTGNSWARLNAISTDRTIITLDRNVEADPSKTDVGTDWAMDDQIVVGTTDWYPSHSELRSIKNVNTVVIDGVKYTQLTLDRALDYKHNAKIFDTDELGVTFTGKVNRKAADLRASVGLLSRSIQIRSLGKDANTEFPEAKDCTADKTKPECYFGGHVMFRQAFRDVQIQGVEFKQLGQGGRMGHYPVHFHLAKSTAYTQGRAFVKDSAIWDSMTRFVVVHGTHGVTMARNVGYLSMGDGYYFEDGSEIENKVCHNLGVGARASLQEYFTAQAKLTPLPLAARYVPPILDGVLPKPNPGLDDPNRPVEITGSDTYMPVMFWFMNAYNELVGNNAVGVHGFGSCYWLLGSGVSGPSFSMHSFAGLAKYNVAADHQAPLLRFRGNSCMTAALALPASAELPPATVPLNTENTVGFHAVPNPYIAGKATIRDLNGQYARPAVNGDFKPIQPNTAGSGGSVFTNCAQVAVTGTEQDTLEKNTKSCVTTVIDRFNTSYNWAEVNFGSIWFRPWFYLFLNSAMTDQLFGGLTFVTAGSWMQVPPGYFSLAKNSLFVGTSQYGATASEFARRSGPIFRITDQDSVASYAPCQGPKSTCNIDAEGTGYWRDFFQPKRLITIYDGPHFADGNTFVNVGSWICNPQPCRGKSTCNMELECGIYSSTVQPAVLSSAGPVDPTKMAVIDAAIGWKQPNGFYYPPAFTYRKSNFVKSLPDTSADVKELNKCFSFGKEDDFKEPSQRDGSCRHNVIDRTRPYIKGNLISPNAAPQIFGPGGTMQPVTPIDFSTILLDVDGSLTGANGSLSGEIVDTSSVSRNPFFDAPSQSPECLSFGLQTSPYQFVTTMLAPLAGSPAAGDTSVKPWMTLNCKNGFDDNVCVCPKPPPPPTPDPNPHDVASSPLVPIYRQWRFPGEPVECGPICSASKPGEYACDRGTYMIGPDVGHATYLTMAQPQALMPSAQPGALYYIDTNAGGGGTKPDISCITARTCVERPPTFTGNQSYVLYDLFARNDSKISYQLYVGQGSTLGSLAGRYVHVTPHLHAAGDAFQSGVRDACDPSAGTGWCKDLPVPSVDANGVLTVVLDQSRIKDDYQITKRPDFERCMPRNFCYFDGTQCKPCTKDNANCIGQAGRVQGDIDALAHLDGNSENPLNVICQDWGGFASGTKTTTLGERSFVDCPASGCLGFAFTLPANFAPKPYNDVGAPLSHCFDRSAWQDDALVALKQDGQLVDPLCKEPRTPVPSDFCTDPGRPTATSTPTGMGATPTNTATGPAAPTNTPTRAGTATATATATPSGGATATATTTGRATPSATPTITPTPIGPTQTVTPTPGGGGFSWTLDGMKATTVTVPTGGMGYPTGQLFLVDSQGRFCTAGGLFPTLRVDVAGQPIVGIFPNNTADKVGIAHIPGASQAGKADLLVETRIPCRDTTAPTMLRFSGAITYGP